MSNYITKDCTSKLSKQRMCNISGMAKSIELKLSQNVELYQKTLCAQRLYKWRIYNILGIVKVIKFKLSEDVEGDAGLNQNTLNAARLSKGSICNISRTPLGINLKLTGNIKVNQNTPCTSMLSKRRVCNISEMAKDVKLELSENVEEE